MNIYVELNKIIVYIENHLEEKIDYKKIASIIGVNEYTFQRIFAVICNISLTEYIRNRRLSNAGQQLYLGKEKIIDIAIKYQYDNPTSFSRAFEKFHGIKPSEVRKKFEKLKIYTKLHFNETVEQVKTIEYRIIENNIMTLYGKSKNTNNMQIGNDAPKFYQEMAQQYGEAPYGMTEYTNKERCLVKSYWVLYSEPIEEFEKK